MSKSSKISFLIAALFLTSTFVIHLLIGWLVLSSFLLGFAALCVALAIFFDRSIYLEFFAMRTTKHGMSMGATILLTLTMLVCVNYLANRHNKTFDFTFEKLNSLSEQTVKILSALDGDVEFKVFYAGPAALAEKNQVNQNLKIFSDFSPKVKVEFINSYVQVPLAVKYLSNVADRDSSPVICFIDYKGKRMRVPWPVGEEQVVSAMIKATRAGEKKIYFVQGHGEREVKMESAEGLSEFARALEEASFQLDSLNLLEVTKVPDDAAAIAVVGPGTPFLEQEIRLLREYVLSGGRLFLAIDPGLRHNLANLTKPLGVEFSNNVVVSVNPRISGRSQWTIAATQFDSTHDVTASIPNGSTYVVMDLASRLLPAGGRDEDLIVSEIVKSSASSFVVNEVTAEVPKGMSMAPVTLAVAVRSKSQKFAVIVFGDSDFIANKNFTLFSNRDVGLNSIASLANEVDLISIRPKAPKGTVLALTAINQFFFVLAVSCLPIIFALMGGVVWYRRRGA